MIIQHCKTCDKTTNWKTKKALLNTPVDGQGNRAYSKYDGGSLVAQGITISRRGLAKLVNVIACTICGRSIGL